MRVVQMTDDCHWIRMRMEGKRNVHSPEMEEEKPIKLYGYLTWDDHRKSITMSLGFQLE